MFKKFSDFRSSRFNSIFMAKNMLQLAVKRGEKLVNVIMIGCLLSESNASKQMYNLIKKYRLTFKSDGVAKKINTFKQTEVLQVDWHRFFTLERLLFWLQQKSRKMIL